MSSACGLCGDEDQIVVETAVAAPTGEQSAKPLDGPTTVEITAPAGKLSVLFKTDADGRAVVELVRESSPLLKSIKPGDRIIKINDDDTSSLNHEELVVHLLDTSAMPRTLVIQHGSAF